MSKLSKRFGGVRAIDEATFEVSKANIVGIVGPNGAGKSSLFDVLSGFLRPDSGAAFMEGRRIDALDPEDLADSVPGISRSFQEVRVFEHLTVLDNLLVARRFRYGTSPWGILRRRKIRTELLAEREIAEKELAHLGIGALSGRMAAQLSYGQRKLLELGRCLAARKQLILLDEPFAGISGVMIAAVSARILDECADNGTTFLIADHNREAINSLCNVVLEMRRGRIADRYEGRRPAAIGGI